MAENLTFDFIEAKSTEDFARAAKLFEEYADHININLDFQEFDQELREIGKQYARPTGALVMAFSRDQRAQGCFGVRKIDETVCELKRMYVREDARGQGLGGKMLKQAIEVARELKYKWMRLDTLPTMVAATHLYRQFGFYEIAPYRYNPIAGTRFFELEL